jgi:hypothetical protein
VKTLPQPRFGGNVENPLTSSNPKLMGRVAHRTCHATMIIRLLPENRHVPKPLVFGFRIAVAMVPSLMVACRSVRLFRLTTVPAFTSPAEALFPNNPSAMPEF